MKIEAKKLVNLIRKTIYAIDEDEIRENIKCGQFTAVGYELSMVGSDGKRLSRATETSKFSNELRLCLCKEDMSNIVKMFKNEKGEIDLDFGENPVADLVVIKGEKAKFACTSFKYPVCKWEAVVPRGYDKLVTLSKTKLLVSIKELLALEKKRSANVEFRAEGFRFQVIVGENNRCFDVLSDYAMNTNCVVNSKYIVEALKPLSEDEVVLELSTKPLDPIVVRGDDNTFCGVIAPLRP